MTPRVGDVVRIGRGNVLWTVLEHYSHDYGDVVVHLWTLRSQRSGQTLHHSRRSDETDKQVALVWTLEEVVFGGEVVTRQ